MDPDGRQYETGIIRRIAKSDFAMYYSSSSFRLATAFTTVYERAISPRADFPFSRGAVDCFEPATISAATRKGLRPAERNMKRRRSGSPRFPIARAPPGAGAARPEDGSAT